MEMFRAIDYPKRIEIQAIDFHRLGFDILHDAGSA